jgi:hypothetical protein
MCDKSVDPKLMARINAAILAHRSKAPDRERPHPLLSDPDATHHESQPGQ